MTWAAPRPPGNSGMPSLLGSAEPPAPCARCLRKTPGLKWGDLCSDCQADLARRARPLARGISLLAALLVVGYARLRINLTPGNRVGVAACAVAAYFLVPRVGTRIAVKLLRNRPRA